jgi:alkylation response protein AidB-like acyl-CoA dehydrogenase
MKPAHDQDTLRMLADAAADFARPDARRTRAARDTHEGHEPAVWHQLASMGWLAASLPEEQGGLGLGLRAGATIAQRLGYAGYLEPYVAAAVTAVDCLAACGRSASALLGQVVDGRQLAVLAWQPDDGQLEPHATGIAASQSDGRTVLSGSCRYATMTGDMFLVVARAAEGLSLYRVPAGAPGLVVRRETAADGTTLARLTLSGVQAGPEDLLASGDTAAIAVERAVEAGIVATSAELLGVIERSLELTLEYLRTRQQFGQSIGAFQALQHRAVDMWIQKELTRAALRCALDVFDDPQSSLRARRIAASSVKARASQAALYVAGQSVQLHGAIGFTDECELGVYVNRALTLAPRWGNAAQHRRRHAALVAH